MATSFLQWQQHDSEWWWGILRVSFFSCKRIKKDPPKHWRHLHTSAHKRMNQLEVGRAGRCLDNITRLAAPFWWNFLFYPLLFLFLFRLNIKQTIDHIDLCQWDLREFPTLMELFRQLARRRNKWCRDKKKRKRNYLLHCPEWDAIRVCRWMTSNAPSVLVYLKSRGESSCVFNTPVAFRGRHRMNSSCYCMYDLYIATAPLGSRELRCVIIQMLSALPSALIF